jgi:hypothetical protein
MATGLRRSFSLAESDIVGKYAEPYKMDFLNLPNIGGIFNARS